GGDPGLRAGGRPDLPRQDRQVPLPGAAPGARRTTAAPLISAAAESARADSAARRSLKRPPARPRLRGSSAARYRSRGFRCAKIPEAAAGAAETQGIERGSIPLARIPLRED